jgi:hypothetical protein
MTTVAMSMAKASHSRLFDAITRGWLAAQQHAGWLPQGITLQTYKQQTQRGMRRQQTQDGTCGVQESFGMVRSGQTQVAVDTVDPTAPSIRQFQTGHQSVQQNAAMRLLPLAVQHRFGNRAIHEMLMVPVLRCTRAPLTLGQRSRQRRIYHIDTLYNVVGSITSECNALPVCKLWVFLAQGGCCPVKVADSQGYCATILQRQAW